MMGVSNMAGAVGTGSPSSRFGSATANRYPERVSALFSGPQPEIESYPPGSQPGEILQGLLSQIKQAMNPEQRSVLQDLSWTAPPEKIPDEQVQENQLLSRRDYAQEVQERLRILNAPQMQAAPAPDPAFDYGRSLEDDSRLKRGLVKYAAQGAQGLSGLQQLAGELTGIDSWSRQGAQRGAMLQRVLNGMGKPRTVEGFSFNSPVGYLLEDGVATAADLAAGPGKLKLLTAARALGDSYGDGRAGGLSTSGALARAALLGGIDHKLGRAVQGMGRGSSAQPRSAAERWLYESVRDVPADMAAYAGSTAADAALTGRQVSAQEWVKGLGEATAQSVINGVLKKPLGASHSQHMDSAQRKSPAAGAQTPPGTVPKVEDTLNRVREVQSITPADVSPSTRVTPATATITTPVRHEAHDLNEVDISNEVLRAPRIGNGTKGQGSGNKVDLIPNRSVIGENGEPLKIYPQHETSPYASQEFLTIALAHGFPNMVDNYAGYASVHPLKNSSHLYQLLGNLNGKDGRFEWIIDPTLGGVTHRMFVSNGNINGKPTKP